ncbi:MAG: hypothetical protein HY858_02985, partial [Candidatus Solibacter usitatus]|nr:hypothetical protein [Candidatus Solibacter usitatus]
TSILTIGGSIYDPGFQGLLDEVRVSSIARTPDWIVTEYQNQNAPATFFSVGAQQ